ncbi:hypothetical protein J8F10_08855 [Gemmata sp. G18]|uniref:DUF1559 domain-containing protein n=1 Tax=Gemmata palustris TaxID=2822762 RepID=A0ABS5BNX0_9BACT|nr:hypothetical protein [Gemmata palustris]MBP3955388.1 hypothetical protein [Gemmata palustris]
MPTIDMPTSPGISVSRFGLETNTRRFESPETKASQRMVLGGARWIATYSLPPMKRDKAANWQAFLLKLEGGANTFNAYDPDAVNPRGSAGGAPLVKGAGQTGNSLLVDGCPASVTGWLLPGDYIGVNGEMKMVTGQVNTNGSGEGTIPFKPRLRNSPADNATVTLTRPSCEMALIDDQQAIWECNEVGLYMPKTFTAVEVFS